jgi:ketosteroid isomerase-like protein
MGRSARFVSAVFALVAFGSGCGGADKASPAPRVGKADSDRKAAVEAALQKYSGDVAKMDDEAISESYTTDGEMGSAGGKPVKGRAAIAHHLRTLRDYKVLSSVVTSESVTFEGSDAYHKGTFQQQVLTPSGKSI